MPQATQPHYGRPATGQGEAASQRPIQGRARGRRSIARRLFGKRPAGSARSTGRR